MVYGSSEPTPTPPPPDGTMHVSAIDMRYAKAGKSYVVYTTVTIADDAVPAAPVSGATVSVRTTLPGGSTATGSGVTGADGKVTFSVKSKLTGPYTSEVTGVTHASYTYVAGDNVITSKTLPVP